MIRKNIGSNIKTANTEGIIFDIQKFSIHDGPGIRTIVFLKGCPLACKWCSNPESQKHQQEIMWKSMLCVGCNKCEEACPQKAISTKTDGSKHFDRIRCVACGTCDSVCFRGAITLAAKFVNVDEIMCEVEQDMVFYETSGGGLTVGGGEPLLQPKFAAKLLKVAKEKGIHTAIETAGEVPWKNYEKVLPYADLILQDIKIMDRMKHLKYTGQYNDRILENCINLGKTSSNFCIRMPLIPGVNDDDDSIAAVAKFAGEIGAFDIELLQYHQYGVSKYEQLEKKYRLPYLKSQSDEEMTRVRVLAEKIFKINSR